MADHQQEYAEVVARAWSDGAFKAKLLSDPATALNEMGVSLPDGITIKVVENTDSLFHLVLLHDEYLGDPATALKEMGVTLPDGITMKVIENTDSLFHLVLPPQPDGDLEDEALDKIVGEAQRLRLSDAPCPMASP